MGIFSKFINNNKENVNEAGYYRSKLVRCINKKDFKNDTIMFKFLCYRIDMDSGEIENKTFYVKFNFHNKNDSICEYFIDKIQNILIYVLNNNKEKVLSILDKVSSLEELCNEINKEIENNNVVDVILNIKEKNFNGKKIYVLDYNDEDYITAIIDGKVLDIKEYNDDDFDEIPF